jgi:hypothetical protein
VNRPRKAIRIGVPVLVIGLLALAALWRVGSPPEARREGEPAATREPLAPLTRLAEVASQNSIARQASLEGVRVRELPSERTAWIDAGSAPLTEPATERIFAVLDPDVKRPPGLRWEAGVRVTLIGLVRPSPDPATAIRQWGIDDATAADLEHRGTYLHVTEIRTGS